jgi:microcystin-dependent protein
MILKINDVIGIILIIIIIIIIIIYKFKNEHFVLEHFVDNDDKKKIVKEYGIHISALRNMGQLAAKALNNDTLYLPINIINIDEIMVKNKTEIMEDLNIKNEITAERINDFETPTPPTLHFDIYPRFMIMPWSGDITKLPKKWVLCDGSTYVFKNPGEPTKYVSGTDDALLDTSIDVPDMSGKFILNVNKQTYTAKQDIQNIIPIRTHQFNSTGGTNKEHLISNHIPLHNHYLNLTTVDPDLTFNRQQINSDNDIGQATSNPVAFKYIGTEYNNGNIDINKIGGTPQGNIPIKDVNFHIINTLESASTSEKDGNPYYIIWDVNTGTFKFNHTTDGHENMPPYYTLYYIIKL